MSPRSWRLRVQDILLSLDEIKEFTHGLTLEEFKNDRKSSNAVIRSIEVIGEAASHMPETLKDKYTEIPWRILKDVRNLLSHQYFGVDKTIIWQIATVDLPPLLKPLQSILEKEVE